VFNHRQGLSQSVMYTPTEFEPRSLEEFSGNTLADHTFVTIDGFASVWVTHCRKAVKFETTAFQVTK